MMHITEDTPPDMLVGAMDLTVHLPTGRSVKMSVERSTPMMDLLVQITTTQHLQLSGYIIQALGMAPSAEYSDTILPYKPNTPIGALDTQHIKVIPKGRTLPVPKNLPPGHQPFESTFRLKVHLPRNQLYVCRVSRHARLEEIGKKVCEEKNLDMAKYELRHPGNLDEVLDYKLTLSDYQITEIYVVNRGTVSLTQTFSSSDIMALRKEEERKQMAAKTGGGVFNLIFKRGKTNKTPNPVVPETRSISPTDSDELRSTTPPVVPPPVIQDPPPEKPRPPQRKRRPAPKPPQPESQITVEKAPSEISNLSQTNTLETQSKKLENGLTICHSRNSSDSSGFHETSVLSENCTLPRKQRHGGEERVHSQSVTNLDKMSMHSKSTSSLSHAGRKKRVAPPPPPVAVSKPASPVSNVEKPSPLDASQTIEQEFPVVSEQVDLTKRYPLESSDRLSESCDPVAIVHEVVDKSPIENTAAPVTSTEHDNILAPSIPKPAPRVHQRAPKPKPRHTIEIETPQKTQEDVEIASEEIVKVEIQVQIEEKREIIYENLKNTETEEMLISEVVQIEQNPEVIEEVKFIEIVSENRAPEIVGAVFKESPMDSPTNIGGFKIDGPLEALEQTHSEFVSTNNEILLKSMSLYDTACALCDDDLIDVDTIELFSGSTPEISATNTRKLFDLDSSKRPELYSRHSVISLQSVESLPSFMGNSNMKKWTNYQDLDELSLHSGSFFLGDATDASEPPSTVQTPHSPPESLQPPSYTPSPPCSEISTISISSKKLSSDSLQSNKKVDEDKTEETKETISEIKAEAEKVPVNVDEEINEIDWQYQLPSPPKDFRDSSPANVPEVTNYESTKLVNYNPESVITSPELFEKLSQAKGNSEIETTTTTSDSISNLSDEDKKMCNKLTLEHLEKRKTLVYNRELSTSLKMSEESKDSVNNKKNIVLNELEDVIQNNYNPKSTNLTRHNSQAQDPKHSSNINFVITTYDAPKKQINIFEDESVHSNKDTSSKRNSFAEPENTLRKHSFTGRSMENIAYRKRSVDEQSGDGLFKKPLEISKYRSNYTGKSLNGTSNNYVARSGSFSIDYELNNWKPLKPVKRSRSQVALIRNESNQVQNGHGITKSGSFMDVSGLQSLGVMRMIQTKLNTPTTSVENLAYQDAELSRIKSEKEVPMPEPIAKSEINKSYQYHSPPAINLGTWSERPKSHVSLKDDTDYKITNPRYSMNLDTYNSNNVSIKVNGAEPSNNVVIKIGQRNDGMFRKPLSNVNGTDRPHSVSYDSNFDISRVPIVRSVELKKPYKDNKSVTHIFSPNAKDNNCITTFSDRRRSSEASNEEKPTRNFRISDSKPIVRISSFVKNGVPVVRGFRSNDNRRTWSPNTTALPSKVTLNNNVEDDNKNAPKFVESKPSTNPFGNVVLRSTHNGILRNNSSSYNSYTLNENGVTRNPPPPPQLPKITSFTKKSQKAAESEVDNRSELLSAIRNFGGKKGLKAVNA